MTTAMKNRKAPLYEEDWFYDEEFEPGDLDGQYGYDDDGNPLGPLPLTLENYVEEIRLMVQYEVPFRLQLAQDVLETPDLWIVRIDEFFAGEEEGTVYPQIDCHYAVMCPGYIYTPLFVVETLIEAVAVCNLLEKAPTIHAHYGEQYEH